LICRYRDNPITHAQLNLTQLKISTDGNLVISNGATESRIWSTHIVNRTETGRLNTTVVLLNSGNLVIMENSSNPIPLWQSFDYPTDIVLPGAKIGYNKVTGLTRQYISKKNLIDPGIGSYCTELQINGALVHRSWNPSNVFWSWGSVRSSAPKLVPLLQSLLDINPETRGLIRPAYVDSSEEEYYNYTLLNESSYIFYVHDISGQTKLNVWSQDKQSWQTLYTHPSSPCTAYATCGPFTVCSGNSNPYCGCMESFSQKSPRDWEFGDRTGGCVRDNPLDCINKKNKTSSADIFHPIARVTLPHDPEIIKDATTQSKCIEACLNDCSCTAYSYNNSICSIWHGDLVDVKMNDGIDNNSEDQCRVTTAISAGSVTGTTEAVLIAKS
ncbi:G-type lectin S-receptor-like serine/threonine-protein kinase, partial [Dichanthelium oligosanthes]